MTTVSEGMQEHCIPVRSLSSSWRHHMPCAVTARSACEQVDRNVKGHSGGPDESDNLWETCSSFKSEKCFCLQRIGFLGGWWGEREFQQTQQFSSQINCLLNALIMMSVFRSLCSCFSFGRVSLCLDQSVVADVCSTHDSGNSSWTTTAMLLTEKTCQFEAFSSGSINNYMNSLLHFCHHFSGYGTGRISHSICCPLSSVCPVFSTWGNASLDRECVFLRGLKQGVTTFQSACFLCWSLAFLTLTL